MMQRNVILPLAASTLVLLLGCSDENINMGQGVPVVEAPPLPSSSRCRESPVLQGEVVVHNQAELDTLEGCESIDGDLYVAAFEGANLHALHALTGVSGTLAIGQTPSGQFDVTDPPALDPAQMQAFIEAGWLSSLEGIEALQSAGSLTLIGLMSEDLAPLAQLEKLTDGALRIEFATNLKSFAGLQKLAGLRSLFVNAAFQLESFDGLTLPSFMSSILLEDVDLRQQQALPVTYLDTLGLDDTQLHDLTAFANLDGAGSISIVACQELESLAGLENLQRVGTLHLDHNRYLRELPDFEKVYGLETLRITGSPLLTRLPAFQTLQVLLPYNLSSMPEAFIRSRPDQIKFEDLGSVTSIRLPAGWSSASIVQIANNASLRQIDFTGQSYIDYLALRNNPLLESVGTGELDKVNVLELVDNPKLSVTAFASVRHLDMTATGNADAP